MCGGVVDFIFSPLLLARWGERVSKELYLQTSKKPPSSFILFYFNSNSKPVTLLLHSLGILTAPNPPFLTPSIYQCDRHPLIPLPNLPTLRSFPFPFPFKFISIHPPHATDRSIDVEAYSPSFFFFLLVLGREKKLPSRRFATDAWRDPDLGCVPCGGIHSSTLLVVVSDWRLW